jgi:hypothetical protein
MVLAKLINSGSFPQLKVDMRSRRVSFCYWIAARPLLAIASIFVAGCAGPGVDSSSIGSGSYFQVLDGNSVVLEMETAIAGMQPCQQQAYHLVRENPGLTGRIKCAGSPTTETLAFSAKLRSTPGSRSEFYDTAAYWIRTSTSERCREIVDSSKKEGGTAIVEDKCGA